MKKRGIAIKVILAVLIILLAAAAGFAYALNHQDIPKLYFEGDISEMLDKSDERSIAVRYVDDTQDISGYASLKIQGTSSIAFDKKNYTIKFYSDAEHEDKMKIDVGWGSQNKYCLKANWIDRTHARNVVTARLVSQVQAKYGLLTQAPKNGAVDGFPVEIYSNGDFLGLYTFNIPKDEWQFGMDGDNPDHIVIGGESWLPGTLFQDEPDFETWEVEVGEASEETLEKMKRLSDFIRNSSDEEFVSEFDSYLNLDSVLNYYILAEFAHMDDNLGKNMLVATYDGKVWYLSLYDLDTTWGTFYTGNKLYDYENVPLEMSKNRLFARMETLFVQELAQRYFELREELLTKEHIMAEFQAFRDQIPELVFFKEAMRWGSGPIRRTEDLPGADYEQIEQFLDFMSQKLDAKYAAILESK